MRFRIVKFSMHGQIAACAACPTPLASWTVTNETIAALNCLRLAVFSKRLENKFGVVCSRSMLVLVNVIALTIVGVPCGSGCSP